MNLNYKGRNLLVIFFILNFTAGYVHGNDKSSCGKRKLVHAGEDTTSPHDWPWIAAIFSKSLTGLKFTCGATLVSRNIVITVAQCVHAPVKVISESQLVVYLGRHNLLTWGELDDSQARTVSSIVEHPSYRDESDLIILVLNKPAEFTLKVQPICLPNEQNMDTFSGVLASVISWVLDENEENPQELKLINVPILPEKECKLIDKRLENLRNKNIYCVGFKNDNGGCHGNIGGGIYVKTQDGIWMLQGVIFKPATENSQCLSSQYTLFTDITKFTPWILEQILNSKIGDDNVLAELDSRAAETLSNISVECNSEYHKMQLRYEDKLSNMHANTKNVAQDPQIVSLTTELKEQSLQISELGPKFEKILEVHTEKILRCVGTVIKLELEYLEGRYYYFSDNVTNRNWEDARTFCTKEGMDLASIESEDEYKLMEKSIKRLYGNRGSKGKNGIWLGGSDVIDEGRWKWTATGKPITYNRNTPSCMQNNRNENCLCIAPTRWCDCACSWVGPFICKMYKPC